MNITLPGYLGAGEINGEKVIEKVVGAGIDDHYQLDMVENEFLRPYGVVTLVCIVRHLAHVSKQKVRIVRANTSKTCYGSRKIIRVGLGADLCVCPEGEHAPLTTLQSP